MRKHKSIIFVDSIKNHIRNFGYLYSIFNIIGFQKEDDIKKFKYYFPTDFSNEKTHFNMNARSPGYRDWFRLSNPNRHRNKILLLNYLRLSKNKQQDMYELLDPNKFGKFCILTEATEKEINIIGLLRKAKENGFTLHTIYRNFDLKYHDTIEKFYYNIATEPNFKMVRFINEDIDCR